MKPRISMITLGVRDLAASVRFYEQGLGFPRMESPPEVAFFTLDGTWLGLYDRNALARDATVSPDGRGFESFALAHNVGSTIEVDDVVNQAVAVEHVDPRPRFILAHTVVNHRGDQLRTDADPCRARAEHDDALVA